MVTEAAMESEIKPNARFIILDPNGEYTRALGPTTKFKGRVFKVEAEDGENQLQVPSWFWNSSEWASFTQASPKAQLPLLKRSLRAMRNEEFDLQTNLDVEVKKYLGTILVSLKADKSKGAAALNDFSAKNLLAKINTWRQSLEEYKERLVTTHPELDKLIVSIQDFCVQREGRYPDYNAKVSAVDNIIDGMLSSFQSLGGNECELLPKNEDIPVPFDGGNLVSYLEALAQKMAVSNMSNI